MEEKRRNWRGGGGERLISVQTFLNHRQISGVCYPEITSLLGWPALWSCPSPGQQPPPTRQRPLQSHQIQPGTFCQEQCVPNRLFSLPLGLLCPWLMTWRNLWEAELGWAGPANPSRPAWAGSQERGWSQLGAKGNHSLVTGRGTVSLELGISYMR